MLYDVHMMPIKKFKVGFWYKTDLRLVISVEANNETIALILALDKRDLSNGWCSEEGFRISIERI